MKTIIPAAAKVKKMSYDDKVFLAIERLINGHIVSVHEEAKCYCYKTVQGEVKTVDKTFIQDRISSNLF